MRHKKKMRNKRNNKNFCWAVNINDKNYALFLLLLLLLLLFIRIFVAVSAAVAAAVSAKCVHKIHTANCQGRLTIEEGEKNIFTMN